MKKLTFLFLTGALLATSFGCGGGKDTSPAPNPAYDNSYKGIYKGVLTGSTGHFWVDVDNTDTTATMTFTFDGVNLTLTGAESTDGGNFVYTFSGSGYDMVFEVTPTGMVVTDKSSFKFKDHSGAIAINADKATSTVDVSVWEGTWASTSGPEEESGIWNVIIKGSTIAGTMATTASTLSDLIVEPIEGSLNGTAIAVTVADFATATGTASDSSMSGDWTTLGEGTNDVGTFEGTRTL